MKKWFIVSIFLLTINSIAQQPTLTPTELEQAQLGKLKAQNETLIGQLQQIDTQIQALNILKQLTSSQQQQKYSEYLGKANAVKEAHKDWGDTSKVNFNPQQGESGTFVVQAPTPVQPSVPAKTEVKPSVKK